MNNEVERRDTPQTPGVPQTAAMSSREQWSWAKTLAGSDMLDKQFQGNPANALLAIGLGQTMGVAPAVAVTQIQVIQGKPSASAMLINAMIRRAGHKVEFKRDDAAESVTCTITRRDDGTSMSVTWDRGLAQRKGLWGKGEWAKNPMNMLSWRALTECARLIVPDVVLGMPYDPDELRESMPVHVDAQVIPDDQPATPPETPPAAPQAGEPGEPEDQPAPDDPSPVEGEIVDGADVPPAEAPHDRNAENAQALRRILFQAGARTGEDCEAVLERLTGQPGLARVDALDPRETAHLVQYEAATLKTAKNEMARRMKAQGREGDRDGR